jgi:dextranase
MPLDDLRAFYRNGEDVELERLPPGTARLLARHARGRAVEGALDQGTARLAGLGPGTYAVEARAEDGELLAEEMTTVGAHAGERPVHGFATSFDDDSVPGVLEWLRALRCTVVQIYDWMASYTTPIEIGPLGPPGGWQDPSGRPVSFDALRSLAAGIRGQGAVAHAYAPVYAVDLPFAAGHPELLMYRNDGAPQSFFDFIQLADPSDDRWQRHFTGAYGRAADLVGFNGFHIDTYGYPRVASDREGNSIDMRAAYESFLAFFRSERPMDLISFNQVNGVPSAFPLAPGPRFRYCEVWPPNDAWRHLEGLMDRSAGVAGHLGLTSPRSPAGDLVRGTIACYPPVWAGHETATPGTGTPGTGTPGTGADRRAALRTVVLTEAVATCLGASALLYGDRTAALCDPYYPKHERLSPEEAVTVLAWHRFALRCRDLFIEGEDTSWYEVDDENGAVAFDWSAQGGPGEVRPEPAGGALFARVVRSEDYVAIGLVDLTGSKSGRWSEPTSPGKCRSVRVRALLPAPERWQAAVAVIGRAGDRFTTLPFTIVGHRQGQAVQVEVPVQSGWSVLRLLGPGHHERQVGGPRGSRPRGSGPNGGPADH